MAGRDSQMTGIGGEYLDIQPTDFDPRMEFTFFWKDTNAAGKAATIRWKRIRKSWERPRHGENRRCNGCFGGRGTRHGSRVRARRRRRGPHRARYRGPSCCRAGNRRELGGKGLAVPADVADADQVEAAAARIENELGPIDVWVNNAMTTVFARVTDVTPEEFKRATEVTYLGTVYGTMAALRRMLPRNAGNIIQVGSALAYRSIPLQAAYCGAKHAIAGFTDSLRSELIHDNKNIHLTMVQLPAMNTPQFTWCRSKMPRHPQPVPPIFQPEVAAETHRLGIAPQAAGSLRRRAHRDCH